MDFTVFGELGSVSQQVEQHLTQPGGVGAQTALGLGLQPQPVTFVFDQGLNAAHDLVEQAGKLDFFPLHIHLAGFDLGEVKHVVNETQQVLAYTDDFVQVVADGWVARVLGIFEQQLAETDDGVQGRAQFVAHVGQEKAFGAVGPIGLLPGQLQLRTFIFDLAVLFNEHAAVLQSAPTHDV